MADLLLASASPRRKELLQQIGVNIDVCAVDIDESMREAELVEDFVLRLAQEKAEAGVNLVGNQLPTLGSDTIVVCDGVVMGKPKDQQHAIAMLKQLSGRTHQVLTAVAITDGSAVQSCLVSTDVTFNELTERQMLDYWQTGEPADKAGGYGIQGLGAVFVKHMVGSYSAVVGLPLAETAQLLAKFDIPVWQ